MESKTKNNKKKTALIIGIINLILLIGGSYAYFYYNFLGTDNLINTDSIELEFLESNGEIINLTSALPMSDTEGKEQSETFDFQVKTKSKADIDITYGLYIEKLEADTGYTVLQDNEVKVYLTDFSNNEKLAPLKVSELYNYLLYGETNTHSRTNVEQKDKYKLRIWIDEDVYVEDWNQDTKIQYKFKINVRSSSTKTEIIPECNASTIGTVINGKICAAASPNCFECKEGLSVVQLEDGKYTCK